MEDCWHLNAAKRRVSDARSALREAKSKAVMRDAPNHALWLLMRVFSHLTRANHLLDEHDKEDHRDAE